MNRSTTRVCDLGIMGVVVWWRQKHGARRWRVDSVFGEYQYRFCQIGRLYIHWQTQIPGVRPKEPMWGREDKPRGQYKRWLA